MKPSKPEKVELLAPAGNFEKLEMALHYGADAVYLAGREFSLRNFSGNFSLDEIRDAVALSKDYRAKVYIAINIFARANDIAPVKDYISQIRSIGPDGIIVADPAILSLARQTAPAIPIHLSTQANTTNAEAVKFWRNQGIARVNAARELSLEEIAFLTAVKGVAIEAFVHGAMCISYSGRCLLSNYMANRPGNQGKCCQPCRFKYAVVEETRPGQFFPVSEDDHGTYLFNSKDLCMLDHLPAMIRSGINALKIEGRMKGIHYTATAVNVYRCALNSYYENPQQYAVQPHWREELQKITSRGYCTGFYLGNIEHAGTSIHAPKPPAYALAGKVLAPAGKKKAHIEVRNQIRTGDRLEILSPGAPAFRDQIARIENEQGEKIMVANPGSRVTIHLANDCRRLDIIRKPSDRMLPASPNHTINPFDESAL